MFRRSSDGIAVPASVRMNDGAILIGTINCGMTGRLDALLASDVSFIEFVSKDGHQRFIAHHQIASIEPLASLASPVMPPVQLSSTAMDTESFGLIGVTPSDTIDQAKAMFQEKLRLYNPERWTAPDVPFEFGRYAVEKTRQLNMAFTVVRAALQARDDERRTARSALPMFGSTRAQA